MNCVGLLHFHLAEAWIPGPGQDEYQQLLKSEAEFIAEEQSKGRILVAAGMTAAAAPAELAEHDGGGPGGPPALQQQQQLPAVDGGVIVVGPTLPTGSGGGPVGVAGLMGAGGGATGVQFSNGAMAVAGNAGNAGSAGPVLPAVAVMAAAGNGSVAGSGSPVLPAPAVAGVVTLQQPQQQQFPATVGGNRAGSQEGGSIAFTSRVRGVLPAGATLVSRRTTSPYVSSLGRVVTEAGLGSKVLTGTPAAATPVQWLPMGAAGPSPQFAGAGMSGLGVAGVMGGVGRPGLAGFPGLGWAMQPALAGPVGLLAPGVPPMLAPMRPADFQSVIDTSIKQLTMQQDIQGRLLRDLERQQRKAQQRQRAKEAKKAAAVDRRAAIWQGLRDKQMKEVLQQKALLEAVRRGLVEKKQAVTLQMAQEQAQQGQHAQQGQQGVQPQQAQQIQQAQHQVLARAHYVQHHQDGVERHGAGVMGQVEQQLPHPQQQQQQQGVQSAGSQPGQPRA